MLWQSTGFKSEEIPLQYLCPLSMASKIASCGTHWDPRREKRVVLTPTFPDTQRSIKTLCSQLFHVFKLWKCNFLPQRKFFTWDFFASLHISFWLCHTVHLWLFCINEKSTKIKISILWNIWILLLKRALHFEFSVLSYALKYTQEWHKLTYFRRDKIFHWYKVCFPMFCTEIGM